jgi:paraquat-inducible protein B
MVKGAAPYLTENTRFWIVRPRVGTGGISGLGTLVSGAYVEIDPGQAEGESKRAFVGLEDPPPIRSDVPGSHYVLRADTLGSVGRGAPVYFRGIEVGQVLGYELADDKHSLMVRIFVRAPHDRLVHTNSRFWNASGVGFSTSGGSLRVQLASVQALLVGGIEFDTPRAVAETPTAPSGTEFVLFSSLDEAQEAQFTRKVPFLVNFEGSARGLSPGAPVETRGIRIGSVADVRLAFSEARNNLVVQTLIEIEPERVQTLNAATGAPLPTQDMEHLVARGFRAQLKTANLLTGELFVDLDFYPDAPPATMTRMGDYPVIPAVPTDLEAIQASATAIMNKIANLPLEDLVVSLQKTVATLEGVVASPEMKAAVAAFASSMTSLESASRQVETDAAPLLRSLRGTAEAAEATLNAVERTLGPNSRLNDDLNDTLRELQSAARSIRIFADFLQRNPDALIRGRSAGAR